jgi:hypothetical protein
VEWEEEEDRLVNFNVREVHRRIWSYGGVGSVFLISTDAGRWRLSLKLGRFTPETNTLLPCYRRLLARKSGLNAWKEVSFSVQANRHILVFQTLV